MNEENEDCYAFYTNNCTCSDCESTRQHQEESDYMGKIQDEQDGE